MPKNIYLTRPQAILCDFDNTFYEYQPAHRAALAAVQIKAQQSLGMTPQAFGGFFERARQEVKSRLEGTASSHSRLLYFQRMIELFGMKTQILQTLDFEQTYWRSFLSNSVLFEGARDFVEDLRLSEIPTAVVTDLTAQVQFRKLVYFQLDSFFDYVVTSEETGVDKPHAAPFLLALEKLGVAAGPVWMIGDSHRNDILGARAIPGVVTFQKRHAGVQLGPREDQADVVFDSFVELRRLFRLVLDTESDASFRRAANT